MSSGLTTLDKIRIAGIAIIYIWMASEFVYKSDFYSEKDSSIEKIVSACTSSFRENPFRPALMGIGSQDNITSKVGVVFETENSQNHAEEILRDAGFIVTPFDSKGATISWKLKPHDQAFATKRVEDLFFITRKHVCAVYVFKKDKQLVDWRVFAAVNH
jgi:hypothetical protein